MSVTTGAAAPPPVLSGITHGAHVGQSPSHDPPPRGEHGDAPVSDALSLVHSDEHVSSAGDPKYPLAHVKVADDGKYDAPGCTAVGVAFTLKDGGGDGTTQLLHDRYDHEMPGGAETAAAGAGGGAGRVRGGRAATATRAIPAAPVLAVHPITRVRTSSRRLRVAVQVRAELVRLDARAARRAAERRVRGAARAHPLLFEDARRGLGRERGAAPEGRRAERCRRVGVRARAVGRGVVRRGSGAGVGASKRARAAGDRIVRGGKLAREGGLWVEPTLIEPKSNQSEVVQSEIFGPVLTFQTFTDEDDAIRLANSTAYGLSGIVYTKSAERAERVGRAVRAGTVWVNTFLIRDLTAPFGGIGISGIGREGGDYALDFQADLKTLQILEGSTDTI